MLLAIDVGNTQSHLGLFDSDELVAHWRFATASRRDGRRARGPGLRHARARGLDLGAVDGSIVSSVVPQLTPEYVAMCERYLEAAA